MSKLVKIIKVTDKLPFYTGNFFLFLIHSYIGLFKGTYLRNFDTTSHLKNKIKLYYFSLIYNGSWDKSYAFYNKYLKYSKFYQFKYEKYNVNTENKKFNELLVDKNIVILGPAKLSLGNIEKEIINKASIIVIFNLDEASKLLNKDYDLTNKILISYWSKERFIHFKKLKANNNFPAHFNVVRLEEKYSLDVDLIRVKGIPRLGINANPNLLQVVIYDLQLRGVNKIFVYGADLMVSANRIKGYYPESWTKFNLSKKELRAKNFIGHDPIEQFLLLQRIYTNKNIIWNKRLDLILKKGLRQYLNSLSNNY